MKIVITLTGTDQLIAKLSTDVLVTEPMREFFERSTDELKQNIRDLTPQWHGGLRGDIQKEVDSSSPPTWAKVGTNLFYAIFVEMGTQPHWPPIKAIAEWANYHGIPPFLVARAISLHGTPAIKMFEEGTDNSMDAIDGFMQDAGEQIKEIWES